MTAVTPSHNICLISRPLIRSEAVCLHRELKSTPNILGYSVPELLRFREVVVAEVDSQFAGVCLSKDLRFGWTDLAVLYVLPEFRGKGIGGLLFQNAFDRAGKTRHRDVYALSRSPEALRLMQRAGMTLSTEVWRSPFAVHLYNQCHMLSLYRQWEAFRKLPSRFRDGNSFQFGTRRASR